MKTNSLKAVLNLKYLVAILIIGLAIRLFISSFPSHVDILSVAGWGRWINLNGPLGFYEHNVWLYSWPTQPPLVNLVFSAAYSLYLQLTLIFTQIGHFIAINHLGASHILWYYDFVRWFGEGKYLDTDYPLGYILSLKFLGIFADIIIGLVIYFLARKISNRIGLLSSAFYLFSPFSFYISALWGQHDQLSFLFLLLSFLALLQKKIIILAPVLLALSTSLKPTSLIFAPLFLWIYFRQKPNIAMAFVGIIFSVLLIYLSIMPLSKENPIAYFYDVIYGKMVFKAEFRVTTNSFNFWHILIGNRAEGQSMPFFFIPANYWGYFIYGLLNLLAFKITKIINSKNIFTALFIIGMGSWLFMTNMLERYLFAGITFGLILTIYNPKLLKYWIVLSVIFWINLYHGWWNPEIFDPLRQILIWQEGFLTRILSVVNVIIFLKILGNLQIFPRSLKKFRIKLPQ